MILVVHCNEWFLRDWGGITTWSAGRGMIVGGIRAFIQSLTCIGVDCFVLISGFFSIKPKIKSVVNLYSIPLFFYIICYFLSIYLGKCAFAWNELGTKCFAFSAGNNWFVQSYLMLMLLSPIINAFVEKCTEKSLLTFIAIYMVVMFYFSIIWDSDFFFFNHGYSFSTFICIYLIGRYIKLYGLNHISKYPISIVWFAFALSILAMTLLRFISNHEERWLSYESPFLIIPAALLLVCFARMTVKSKFVNLIAPSCLAVFIFHTCSPIIDWLTKKDVMWFTALPFHMYLLYMGGGDNDGIYHRRSLGYTKEKYDCTYFESY